LKYFTLLALVIFSFHLNAQSIKGIWRGYFIAKNNEKVKNNIGDKFNFEIQINQLSNNSLKGVTYSYKAKEYYGRANFDGVINEKKEVIIREIGMIEVEKNTKSDVCIMACNLKYSSKGKVEILSGSFTSSNPIGNKFCFVGTIYLEKVINTVFVKAKFLLQTEPIKIKKNQINISDYSRNQNISDSIILSNKQLDLLTNEIIPDKKITTNSIQIKDIIIPDILLKRENLTVKRIVVNQKDIQIAFYDNGVIDNDTISVYVNNKLQLKSQRVSYTPIILNIHLDEINCKQEIITVAENLGEIPPNTALMVITVLKERYEIPIVSNFKTNARVILEYSSNKKIQIEHF
jgi:hypothetical protein